ncbi:MMPL family transporter [Virgibacillus xinjiangensis]|uniref:MMPL family transporter n=1 Tax=Virgibacillus xinjiangensis TaxID=393090 RepID=A0ABV7CZ60_9BACI
MRNLLQSITDRASSKRGVWITLGIWLSALVFLSIFAPSAHDYQVSSIETLPDDAPSVVAQKKVEDYFGESDQLPAILVFHKDSGAIDLERVADFTTELEAEQINGIEEVLPFDKLPPQAIKEFITMDRDTAYLPLQLDGELDTAEIKQSLNEISAVAGNHLDSELSITGPAGIAVDTNDLFSRADLVLIMATVAIILVLLVLLYRSPLLALIPLLAAGFIYQVTMQVLGIWGKAGLLMSTQSISIMTILLFAAMTDYSLFVFSRFREELKREDNKYEAMKQAMRGTGLPVFYSGATVLAAMLLLLFATLGDYQNFAPIFGTAIAVIMLASVTLVPCLFTIFGRRSFWPVIPKVGDPQVKASSFWARIGKFIVKKPVIAVTVTGTFLLLSAVNVFNLEYEFNLLKSFPEDLPSREGFTLLEENFEAGELAPTTVLLEAEGQISEEEQEVLRKELANQPLTGSVQLNSTNDQGNAFSYRMVFEENPYSTETMDALESIRNDAGSILEDAGIHGALYFAGETAASIDDRSLNNRDLLLIVLLETVVIFLLLAFLTRSFKMPVFMMGTNLLSFAAALGLGMFLTSLLFDISSISNRVPVYAFIFLVAVGIDYNIMLISRYLEEKEKLPVKESVETAVTHTGGIISSAGLILAATFAVLMTQPIQLLFVFGFIVAVGILIDTFVIRGVLLPGLLVLFDKKRQTSSRERESE